MQALAWRVDAAVAGAAYGLRIDARPPELYAFAASYAVDGEDQEKAPDEEDACFFSNDSRAILKLGIEIVAGSI